MRVILPNSTHDFYPSTEESYYVYRLEQCGAITILRRRRARRAGLFAGEATPVHVYASGRGLEVKNAKLYREG